MTGRSFIDTNVLAYAYDRDNVVKRELARQLVKQRMVEQTLLISAQVLNELVSTLLKPKFGLSLDDARRAIRAFEGAPLIELDLALTLRALDARQRYQVSLWDGLIIAAAERGRCSEVLTEDLNHGQEYFGGVARNPFLNAVSEL